MVLNPRILPPKAGRDGICFSISKPGEAAKIGEICNQTLFTMPAHTHTCAWPLRLQALPVSLLSAKKCARMARHATCQLRKRYCRHTSDALPTFQQPRSSHAQYHSHTLPLDWRLQVPLASEAQ